MRYVKDKTPRLAAWVRDLPATKPFRVVSVALARIAWAVLTKAETYKPNVAPP